jgi:hypothetical protein
MLCLCCRSKVARVCNFDRSQRRSFVYRDAESFKISGI